VKKSVIVLAMVAAAAAAGYWFGKTTTVRAAENRVFEIRTYTAPEGKLDDLHARFRNHTVDIFKKHGMESIAYFAPMDDPLKKNTLIYILAFPSRDAAKKSWAAFASDPEWQKVAKESEANGKILSKIESVYAEPADYSPLK